MASLATRLVDPIREGSFPDSASVLSADLDSDAINELLESIAKAKDELNTDLREVSRPYAGGVDEWIALAQKAQDDIARCKQEAQHIVQEHSRLEQLRTETLEAKSTAKSLSDEIDYSKELQAQLHGILNVWQGIQSIEASLANEDIVDAAQAVTDMAQPVAALRGPGVKLLFSDYRDDLVKKTTSKLESRLTSRVTVQCDANEGSLGVGDSIDGEPTNEALLHALTQLGSSQHTLDVITERIEAFVSRTLSPKTARHLRSHTRQKGSFSVTFGDQAPTLPLIFSFSKDLTLFLHADLPAHMYAHVTASLGPRLVSSLVTDWLTPAIPVDLEQVDTLDFISTEVTALASFLDSQEWPNAGDLRQWTQLAPRMWISKRKSEALDAVRKAFARSRGSLHQVERVERQRASTSESAHPEAAPTEEASDDWNTSWDDEDKPAPGADQKATTEDDTSGWGFDDEMEDEPPQNTATNGSNKDEEDIDNAEDAWGWADDDADGPKVANTSKGPDRAVNGEGHNIAASQELVMTELYSITDIPEHLIESIGKDIQDATTLQGEDHASLKGVPASSGLLALPSLSLAMFRATAPTHYSKTPELGNMNLYNDALYMADKLRHMPSPTGMNDVEKDCLAMDKFARAAYAREMETQRTILGDLLDGVQGFTIPYAEQIEDAIAATSDRLRQVHADWSPILSKSALLQSTGALLSSVLSKVITDIEEMDDISEVQSQRLTQFCGQLAKLEDLFISRPFESQAEQEPVPMVAVYCSNWLRFQYLINILESNLQDIKYLWTEGELSLEFSQEEVVDLVKALFAESSHRRSAIAAIRGHRASGL